MISNLDYYKIKIIQAVKANDFDKAISYSKWARVEFLKIDDVKFQRLLKAIEA